MTKKRAYKIIEKQYGKYDAQSCNYIDSLCWYLDKRLQDDWTKYWSRIDKLQHHSIFSAFFKNKGVETSLCRLLMLNHFIEDTYK